MMKKSTSSKTNISNSMNIFRCHSIENFIGIYIIKKNKPSKYNENSASTWKVSTFTHCNISIKDYKSWPRTLWPMVSSIYIFGTMFIKGRMEYFLQICILVSLGTELRI